MFALCLALCTAVLPAQSGANAAEAAAREAAARLDAALSGRPYTGGTASGTASGGGTSAGAAVPQAQATRGGPEPAWVNDPSRVYNRNQFHAAVGFAGNRAEAEKKALANLVAFFGQSVRSDFSIVTRYSEAISNGLITTSESNNLRDMVTTAASMDTLIGAEIGPVWDDARGTVYALAFMEKGKAIAVYTELIRLNQLNITKLTDMGAQERNTLNGYARYMLASILAGVNTKYAIVVTQSGGSTASLNMTDSGSLNTEAATIKENISIAMAVEGDTANRVRDAFAKALADQKLQTRGRNPPYTLEVKIFREEVRFPNNSNIFCRITLSAELIENATDQVLLPFNYTDRVGGLTYSTAEASALNVAVRAVQERYPDLLREYLGNLMPQ